MLLLTKPDAVQLSVFIRVSSY